MGGQEVENLLLGEALIASSLNPQPRVCSILLAGIIGWAGGRQLSGSRLQMTCPLPPPLPCTVRTACGLGLSPGEAPPRFSPLTSTGPHTFLAPLGWLTGRQEEASQWGGGGHENLERMRGNEGGVD